MTTEGTNNFTTQSESSNHLVSTCFVAEGRRRRSEESNLWSCGPPHHRRTRRPRTASPGDLPGHRLRTWRGHVTYRSWSSWSHPEELSHWQLGYSYIQGGFNRAMNRFSTVLDDKFMCEFTISLLDSKQPFEGLIEGLFENAPKLFWHCCRHCRATKDSALDRDDYQLQYYACNKQYLWTFRSGIPPGTITLNFENSFILRICVFDSR
jgi:hypothetical protein